MKNYNYNFSIEELKIKTRTFTSDRKNLVKPKRRKIDSTNLPKEDIYKMLEHYYEISERDKNKKDINKNNKIIEKSNTSARILENVGIYSKSIIHRIRNNKLKRVSKKQIEIKLIDEVIRQEVNNRNGIIGREPLTWFLKTKNPSISLSSRQIGRYMTKLGLNCTIRSQNRKVKEVKNTKYLIKNIVQRDYNNESLSKRIIATDVTYIPARIGIKQNHVFLSASIDHKTKEIVRWNLSLSNDVENLLSSLEQVDRSEKIIIHSDHGIQYSSSLFKEKKVLYNKWTQSMSRIWNSLDNREIEHLFGVFKTELIYRINPAKLTFNQIKRTFGNYIKYYNNERIQKKLLWMSP
ncbi:MAG: transposase [Mycoplasmoidaceae bacterium]